MDKIQNLKGFRDFLPAEALKRQWLKNIIVRTFKKWGYDPMETPTLEPLELFVGQIGEDEKLFFKFKDNAGRDVALRYDQTVPTCRVVGQYSQSLPMPFRRYQIQPAFRAENPQKGRYREFIQCDADIFGSTSPLADAEVIALSLDIYRQIGFKFATALINDRSLLADFPYEAVVAIDKLEKIGEGGVIADMVKKGIEESAARNYLAKSKALMPSPTINQIFNYLKQSGFEESWYRFEPTLARSFSYSTGAIWEIKIPGFDSGSVLGGERFDNLVERVSGQKIPGVGFGLGFDRTLEAAIQFGLVPEIKTQSSLLVTIFNSSLTQKSLELSTKLRDLGVRTELYPDDNAKIDKQFKYANKKGIPFVAVIGEEEASKNIVKIKDMISGEQTDYPIDNLPKIAANVQKTPN